MKTVIIAYLVLAMLGIPCLAADPIKVTVDGQDLVAFEPSDAQYLLQLRINFPTQQKKIKGLEDLVLNKTKQIFVMDEMLTNLNDQVTVLTDQNVYLQEELVKADAWYHNPWLWAAVGVVLGCSATIAIVEAVN